MQFWGPLFKKDADKLEKVEQTSTEVFRGLEHLLFEESLRDEPCVVWRRDSFQNT